MSHTAARRLFAVGLIATASVALTACAAPEAPAPSTDLAIGSVDLSADCPATIVVQDSWVPQVEIGYLFQLLGEEYTVNSEQKSVSGPLMAGGEYTGVTLDVRAGGPAIGYQTASSQMYSDDSITLSTVGLDLALQLSSQFPTTGVFAALEVSPLMIMWDPETYPDVKDLSDLGPALAEAGGVVRYSEGTAYMDYLLDSGIIPETVLDTSYDGTPGNFVAAGGKDAQQGYADNEPYVYENEVADWGKPLEYQLLADVGWDAQPNVLSVRTADVETLSPCLEKLVPLFQQAEVDYYADPAKTNAMILELVDAYDTGAVYTSGTIDAALETLQSGGLIGNGSNDTVGDTDPDRVAAFFETAVPIYEATGSAPADGLTAEDLYTNEFIDTSIGF